MNVRKVPTVGAGAARPNTSTILFVGAFGQANPAPTSVWQNADIHLHSYFSASIDLSDFPRSRSSLLPA